MPRTDEQETSAAQAGPQDAQEQAASNDYPVLNTACVKGVAAIMGACAINPGVLSILYNKDTDNLATKITVAAQEAALLFKTESGIGYDISFALCGQLVGKYWEKSQKEGKNDIPDPEKITKSLVTFLDAIGDAEYHPYSTYLEMVETPKQFGDHYKNLWNGLRGIGSLNAEELSDEGISIFVSRLATFEPKVVGAALGTADLWVNPQETADGTSFLWPEIAFLDNQKNRRNFRLGLATQIAIAMTTYETVAKVSEDLAAVAFGPKEDFVDLCVRAAIGSANFIERAPEWAQVAFKNSVGATSVMLSAMRVGMEPWHEMNMESGRALYREARSVCNSKDSLEIGKAALQIDADREKYSDFWNNKKKLSEDGRVKRSDVLDALINPYNSWDGTSSYAACAGLARRSSIVKGMGKMYADPDTYGVTEKDDRLNFIWELDRMSQNLALDMGSLVGNYRTEHAQATKLWGEIINSVIENSLPRLLGECKDGGNKKELIKTEIIKSLSGALAMSADIFSLSPGMHVDSVKQALSFWMQDPLRETKAQQDVKAQIERFTAKKEQDEANMKRLAALSSAGVQSNPDEESADDF